MEDLDTVIVSTEIPREWADILKEESKRKAPKKSRKALIFEMVEDGVKKLKRKNKKWS